MADDPVAYHMNEVETFLPTWKKPALIMFGDSDPITRGQDKGGKISECIFKTTNHRTKLLTLKVSLYAEIFRVMCGSCHI